MRCKRLPVATIPASLRQIYDIRELTKPNERTGRSRFRGQIVRSGRHGQWLITREAVEDMVDQLQERPIPMNIEHDPTRVPVGRIVDAELQELGEGEVVIVAEMELFDDTTTALILPIRDLLQAVDEFPSLIPEAGALGLSIDERSYEAGDIARLSEVAGSIGEVRVESGVARFSQIPDALLVIALGAPAAAAWWFARGFFTKAGEALGQEFGETMAAELRRAYAAFKEHMREMVEQRRSPLETEPITLLTLELPRVGGGTVDVEGSSRAAGDGLEAFLDSGTELLAVAAAYAANVQSPDRLAKLHFKHDGQRWRFVYGLDDGAELVMVDFWEDERYDAALRDLQANESEDVEQSP